MERRWLSGSSDQWGDQGSANLLIAWSPQVPVRSMPIHRETKAARSVLYAGTQKYYFALIHVLGTLLIEAPLGHCIFLAVPVRSAFQRWKFFKRGAYIRNYTVYYPRFPCNLSQGFISVGYNLLGGWRKTSESLPARELGSRPPPKESLQF